MKKTSICLVLLALLIMSGTTIHALEIAVEITGDEDFVRLKDGIQKTIAARCIAGNVAQEADKTLSVSLIQLGKIISFDAVLDSQPPQAFHRDMNSHGEISGVIDQMIGEMFTGAARAPGAPAGKPAAAQESLIEIQAPPAAEAGIEVPFLATSMAVLGGTIFVSDAKTLYRLEGSDAVPCWSPPGTARIYRLYPYRDSLLVITNRRDSFHTYQIRDLKTVQDWERCVVPLGDTLVSSRLMTDLLLPDGVNYWEEPATLSNEAYAFPKGFDFVSAWTADIYPSQGGPELVAFDRIGRLTVLNGKNPLWVSDTKLATLPLYFESTQHFERKTDEPDARYYLMPRMLAHNGSIITIANEQGVMKFLRNVKLYSSSRILSFSPDKSGFSERDLAIIRNHYCADIALDQGSLIVLVVKKSTSLIQRIGL
jgi:hypothetical protein